MYVLLIVVCPFVLFLLAIVLSVLQYTDSDYPSLVSANTSCLLWHTKRQYNVQRINQSKFMLFNLYIEEQTTQWPKEKVQKDKQRSTIHTYKTKDRVTGTPLKTGGELRCSGRVGSSCTTSDTRRSSQTTEHKN
jgi:hypothetical protein